MQRFNSTGIPTPARCVLKMSRSMRASASSLRNLVFSITSSAAECAPRVGMMFYWLPPNSPVFLLGSPTGSQLLSVIEPVLLPVSQPRRETPVCNAADFSLFTLLLCSLPSESVRCHQDTFLFKDRFKGNIIDWPNLIWVFRQFNQPA